MVGTTWTIGGVPIQVVDSTRIKGNEPRVGSVVDAQGRSYGGTLVASSVRVQTPVYEGSRYAIDDFGGHQVDGD